MTDNSRRAAASDKALEDSVKRAGITLYQAEARFNQAKEDAIFFTGMSLRAPKDEAADYFVMMRAVINGTACVAFHGGPSVAEAVCGALRRFYNRSLKWREDEYV